MFGVSNKHDVAKIHKQQDVRDCGLFAIAFATVICFVQDLHKPFHQEAMRLHLVQCFERGGCLPFLLAHGTSTVDHCCNNKLAT